MLTPGTLSASAITAVGATVSSTAPSGGTGPYAYQWHRSESQGFTPGSGTAISGATAAGYADTKARPGTLYYYKCAYTDSAGTPDTGISAELRVLTQGHRGLEGAVRLAARFLRRR